MQRRRQRRAVAAVLVVDVLHDFLAPLVLEVDVDVGRLVALLADEALEQHATARRIDLGDAEAVADRRVRRRAAPLAQDALRARDSGRCRRRSGNTARSCSSAISASSCSTMRFTFSGMPSGYRRRDSSYVSRRSQLAGVSPGGTISSGYS